MRKFTLILASLFLALGTVKAQYWSYAKTVEVGEKITDFSTITDVQTVAFKNVNQKRFITISLEAEAGVSTSVTGLSVFKLHRVADNQFTIESAREGYYFPQIQNSGWPNYYMTNAENPTAFEFLSTMADGTTLGEGQFVVKSTTADAYFDGGANDFTGWQGKGDNSKYEVYIVTPSTETYSTLHFTQNYRKNSKFWDAGENLTETCPEAVKNLRDNESHVVRGALTDINVPQDGDVIVTFQHNGGDHAMKILGADIINANGEVIKYDYHFGSTGNSNSQNEYTLSGVNAGDYTLRYFVCDGNDNDHNLENAQGNVTVMGAELRATTLTATLTNAIGNFVFTYEGIPGTEPTITGAYGHTLSSKSFDKNYFTATITFPVTVSSAEQTNATLVTLFENKYIRAVGTDVKVQTTGVSPLDMGALWAIYPALENGAFTFTIKNLSTGKYIYTEPTSGAHNTQGTVTLSETATKFTIASDKDFKIDDKDFYLSINSTNDTDVWLGVHGNTHNGTNISTKAPSTETITLADDQPYAWPIEVDGEFDVQYTRTLIPGIWNPLYLPFEAGLNLNDYDVAEFTSAEGNTVVLTKLTADNEEGDVCLKANKAYVVRAKRDEVLTLDLGVGGAISSNVEVEQELGEDFSVRGNYAVRTGADLDATDRVVGSNGNWGKLKSASTLKPYRLILSVPENFDASQALTMRVLDETTGVEEIIVDRDQQAVIFDLMGRRVETITEGGIYIVNGKKVVR